MIEDATDARWILALRTAEMLEGPLLRPEKRQRLVRLGRVMGLTLFDANLIIAIMQDQARRGHVPAGCPAAGRRQLEMVSAPGPSAALKRRRALNTAAFVMMLIGVEVLIFCYLL